MVTDSCDGPIKNWLIAKKKNKKNKKKDVSQHGLATYIKKAS
jgi:hypothetical protein